MKKQTMVLMAALLLISVPSLSGCTAGRESACRALAEDYLAALQAVAEGDTLTLADGSPEKSGKAFLFQAHSSEYQADFRVVVNEDASVTDDYSSIALLPQARKEFAQLVESALPDRALSCDVSIRSLYARSLDGGRFSGLNEAQEVCGNQCLVRLAVSDGSSAPLSEEEIKALLGALKDCGVFCELTIAGDPRTFEVFGDDVSYTMASGADGGSYIKRYAYSFEA